MPPKMSEFEHVYVLRDLLKCLFKVAEAGVCMYTIEISKWGTSHWSMNGCGSRFRLWMVGDDDDIH